MAHPEARLHLYGKRDASPGRKMGHVLVLDETITRANSVAESIERALGVEKPSRRPPPSRREAMNRSAPPTEEWPLAGG